MEVTEEPKSQISNTLSTASSCQSLTSTFSTKSSSGICADSPARSSADVSYANLDVSGLDDIVTACAGIRLEDSCVDSSFLSATDESTIDFTHNLPGNTTVNFDGEEFNKSQESFILQLDETREIGELNLDQTRDIVVEPIFNKTVQLNETVNYPVTPDKSGNNLSTLSSPENTTNEFLSETIIHAEPTSELKTENEVLDFVSSPVTRGETFSVGNSEVPSVEVGPEICNSSFVKLIDNVVVVVEESKVDLNQTVELSEPLLINNNQDSEAPSGESEEAVVENNSCSLDRTLTLSELEELYPLTVEELTGENNTILIQRKNTPSPGIVDYQNFTPQRQSTSINLDETFDSAIGDTQEIEQTFVEQDFVDEKAEETFVKQDFVSEEIEKIVEEGFGSEEKEDTAVEDPEKALLTDSNNQTFFTDLKEDSSEPNSDLDKLKSEAQRLADDLYNSSLVCTDDNEEFVPASSVLFADLMSVDLSNFNSGNTARSNDRLRSESLYVKFDPLVSNTSMLPQGGNIVAATPSSNNDDKINGEKDIVHNTPKKNPAIDAIDRLLFYSPLPDSTIKKNEEPEKIVRYSFFFLLFYFFLC